MALCLGCTGQPDVVWHFLCCLCSSFFIWKIFGECSNQESKLKILFENVSCCNCSRSVLSLSIPSEFKAK